MNAIQEKEPKQRQPEKREGARDKIRTITRRRIPVRALLAVAILILSVFAYAGISAAIKAWREPEITNTFISDKLEGASELTSAELTYNGLVHYTDGTVPFLTKKAFVMTYRAEVEAGIDLSKVKVNVTPSNVNITVPKIKTMDISVDPDSIQFYDEKFAIFNWTKKEDVVNVIKLAKEDVTQNAEIEKLEVKAKEQTEVLLQRLFEDSIGDRKLVISYQ